MNKDAATRQLTTDLKAVINDADALLEATANDAGAAIAGVRNRLEESLRAARACVVSIEEAVVAQSKAAAGATDEYVHANPWTSIGIAAGIGALLGLLLGRR